MTDSQFLETRAAFALRVKQLHDRLSEQLDAAMAKCGLLIPGKTTGIVQLLYSEGPRSKADIADRLRYSHQLTTQRLAWLLKHGMAETNPDPEDGRRQIVNFSVNAPPVAVPIPGGHPNADPEQGNAYVVTEGAGLQLDGSDTQAPEANDNIARFQWDFTHSTEDQSSVGSNWLLVHSASDDMSSTPATWP